MKKQKGVTLIELLVVMVITVILGTATLGLQYILSQNRQVAIENFQEVEAANVSMNTLVRELRTAQPSQSGTYPLALAQANELIFYSDIDYDGLIERVRYTLSNTILTKGVIDPVGQPVSYPIANEKAKTVTDLIQQSTPLFTYYNGDWPADTTNNPLSSTPSLSEVKLVKIHMEINTDSSEDNKDYTLESFAAIRRLKDNL